MKIVLIGSFNETEILSGPEKVAKRLFQFLSKNSEVHFIDYFREGAKYSFFDKIFGSEIRTDFAPSMVYRLGVVNILKYLFNIKPDVVHIVTFERFVILPFLIKKFLRFKIVYTVNGIVAYEHKLRVDQKCFLKLKDNFVERIILQRSEKLFFLNLSCIQIAKKFYNINTKNITVTNNGVDELFSKNEFKRNFFNTDFINMVCVADFQRSEKGLDFLISTLNHSNLNFVLHIIGPSKAQIENTRIKCHAKMDTKTFAEFLSDKDIFISSSFYEPFSISAIEAMASGLILVVTEETGMSRFIEHRKNGYIYKYGDKKKLLEILENIQLNVYNSLKVKTEAQKIYSDLNWGNIASFYTDNYLKLIKENS